ncbi:hypothetical protein ASPBRDRAFT_619388 [Aspergillus brasiliensis CBS 101740]|uniref:Uncharacterized protein n=1 Tax=Aspergillus brasiliensis (strain CBS 101740 / IMI 381727 / IBT 21946) TaxID=767769 RepID=A0A1L9UFF9_ASPBC|nr:hypothetical protein ASPBRDRAFT_619388 [Aspergillus brasiliensis CBS 101740]
MSRNIAGMIPAHCRQDASIAAMAWSNLGLTLFMVLSTALITPASKSTGVYRIPCRCHILNSIRRLQFPLSVSVTDRKAPTRHRLICRATRLFFTVLLLGLHQRGPNYRQRHPHPSPYEEHPITTKIAQSATDVPVKYSIAWSVLHAVLGDSSRPFQGRESANTGQAQR